jgi:hypothetical protein
VIFAVADFTHLSSYEAFDFFKSRYSFSITAENCLQTLIDANFGLLIVERFDLIIMALHTP